MADPQVAQQVWALHDALGNLPQGQLAVGQFSVGSGNGFAFGVDMQRDIAGIGKGSPKQLTCRAKPLEINAIVFAGFLVGAEAGFDVDRWGLAAAGFDN